MANTTNIDLVKPAGTDHALVSVLNANSDKIDGEAGNVRSNFALVQNTNTATQAISKDQLVVWKGVLKKATSNIANGATLSNSNLTDTKVSTELAALSDQITTLNNLTLSDVFTPSSGITFTNASTAKMKNGRITLNLVGSGAITSGADGSIIIGTTKNAYRPSYSQSCASTVNGASSGLIYLPISVKIHSNGNVYLMIGTVNKTCGNASNPWTTGSLAFSWEI